MAFLQKVSVVRYYDKNGNRVSKSTPGAKRKKEKSAKWYGVYYVGRKKKRVPLATDKAAAFKMLNDLVTDRERGQAGLTNPCRKYMECPLSQHVGDYLADKKAAGEFGPKHYEERSRPLKTVLASIKYANAKTETQRDKVMEGMTLADLSADAVDRYLASLTCGARTKDTYRGAAVAFCNWLVLKGRQERNTLEKVTKPKGNIVRKRRALLPAQCQQLLDVARQRPLQEALTVRKGSAKGEKYAEVRKEVRERLLLLGRERALIYKMAILTALRKGVDGTPCLPPSPERDLALSHSSWRVH